MKKFLALLLFPMLAVASTTYTGTNSLQCVATATTGSESAPSGATVGINLLENGSAISKITVMVVASDGSTNLTAASTLLAYWYNPKSATWSRANDSDLTITGSAISQTFLLPSVNPLGRMTWVPSGVGTGVTIYMMASRGQ